MYHRHGGLDLRGPVACERACTQARLTIVRAIDVQRARSFRADERVAIAIR
jgi:hypothetical protein